MIETYKILPENKHKVRKLHIYSNGYDRTRGRCFKRATTRSRLELRRNFFSGSSKKHLGGLCPKCFFQEPRLYAADVNLDSSALKDGSPKHRKGPQWTTKDHKNTAKDPRNVAKGPQRSPETPQRMLLARF